MTASPVRAALCALACVVVAPQAADTICVRDFADYQVVQRAVGDSAADVRVSGSLQLPLRSMVEARVLAFGTDSGRTDWTAIDTASGDSLFGGSLRVPQGGWCRIAVRGRDSLGAVLCADTGDNRFGVGMNILCIGQSNMVGNGDIHVYTPLATDLAGIYSNDNHWQKLADPYDHGGTATDIDYDAWVGASLVPAFVNSLAQAFPGLPIGIVPAARGAAPLHGTLAVSWVNRDSLNPDTCANLYGNSLANARAAGGVELVIMHQGETDATNQTTREQYRTDLHTLLDNYRRDLGNSSLPLFYGQIACSNTPIATRNRTDSTMQAIREAQLSSDSSPHLYLGAVCIDLAVRLGDDHYVKQAYDTLGGRLANAVKYCYGLARYYRGPAIESAMFSDGTLRQVRVSISHRGGSDFTPASGISGFLVCDDTAAVAIDSAVRSDGSAITLYLAGAIRGRGTLRYMAGKAPDISGAVHDNTPLALPLEPTVGSIAIEYLTTVSSVQQRTRRTSLTAAYSPGQGMLTLNAGFGRGLDALTWEVRVLDLGGRLVHRARGAGRREVYAISVALPREAAATAGPLVCELRAGSVVLRDTVNVAP